MKIRRLSATLLLAFSAIFTACEKEEVPVTLPEKGSAEIKQVDMGEFYTEQIYFDLETGEAVHTSPVAKWDLAFEADPLTGKHVFMNGGKEVWMYNTHQTDITNVQTAPGYNDDVWGYDNPNGDNAKTYVGDWENKNEVYVVKINPVHYPDTFKKIRIMKEGNNYKVEYADLKSKATRTATLSKQPGQNFVYFSFLEGAVEGCEPTSNTNWDFVFTRYRHVYYDREPYIPYMVTGVLLNPYKTRAVKDSVAYNQLNTSFIANAKFTADRNIIGYDWKTFNLGTTDRFSIEPNKVYVVESDRKGAVRQYYKLRFLDFYNAAGLKGSPKFEFERLQ